MKFENTKKNRSSLAILYLAAFFVIMNILIKRNFIDFETVRSLYMPILGISMIAILLDYLVFGNVLLVASIYALILKITRETVNINVIITFGFLFAIIFQMFAKLKNKKR